MIFPGLSGDSTRGYVKSLVKHFTQDKGYICGVFQNRGINHEYSSPHFADLSSVEEVNKVLDHMVNKFKDHPDPHFVGIGASMGANIMLRHAGL